MTSHVDFVSHVYGLSLLFSYLPPLLLWNSYIRFYLESYGDLFLVVPCRCSLTPLLFFLLFLSFFFFFFLRNHFLPFFSHEPSLTLRHSPFLNPLQMNHVCFFSLPLLLKRNTSRGDVFSFLKSPRYPFPLYPFFLFPLLFWLPFFSLSFHSSFSIYSVLSFP